MMEGAALSLANTLASPAALLHSPSAAEGVPAELEYDLRIWGCELIQHMGLHLRLPQVSMCTGQVLFQRFFYRRSMLKFGVEDVAMACIFLASKLEECARRARDVINVAQYLRAQRLQQKYEPMDLISVKYDEIKATLVQTEKHVLKNLGFNVHVQQPHKLIINFFKLLGVGEGDPLVQKAWNYMNDSFRTNVFVRYQPYVVASAVIMLAARALKRPLPMNPPWWTFFDSSLADMTDVCKDILYLYTRDVSRLDLPVTVPTLVVHLSKLPPPPPVPVPREPPVVTPSPERRDGTPAPVVEQLSLPVPGRNWDSEHDEREHDDRERNRERDRERERERDRDSDREQQRRNRWDKREREPAPAPAPPTIHPPAPPAEPPQQQQQQQQHRSIFERLSLPGDEDDLRARLSRKLA